VDEDFAWQFRLQSPPAEVFESLIRAADGEGRLYGVDSPASTLTYASAGVDEDQGGWIRATVRQCSGGSLIDIVPTLRLATSKSDVASQAASVASLIGQLRRYYPNEIVASTES
jgi:hypothetical protein